ncbi:MAG: hypothetical protein ACYTFN_04560, partial [Planctomycetota bacterium]
ITGLFRTGGRTIKPFDPVIGRSNLSGLPAIVDVYMRNLLDEQLGNGAGTPPDRTLDVELGFSSNFVPLRFKTYDPLEVTQQDLDVLQKQIYSHVQHQVLRSAHQNPVMEDMNLPYRSLVTNSSLLEPGALLRDLSRTGRGLWLRPVFLIV